ncbi:MAG TPA: response regulator transcription factor [Steroidobacteraceae bacterium]|nr:response regulator transcription factor [Steroidobacteraceae bacterium]
MQAPSASVLLIDDDVEFTALLGRFLLQEGFNVAAAHEGEHGINEALSGRHAIAVLDVMMPGLNGFEVLRRIRAQSTLPIVMLTARGDDTDRIVGLEVGADDYVAKPCTPRELTARLRAILRRAHGTSTGAGKTLNIGPLAMWPEQRRAEWSGQPLQLTSTEFTLLEVLARNAGRTVSKNELSTIGLGRPLARYDRSVDVHLSSIRHKLGALADGRSCIQTVFRKGYQLIKE